MTSAAERWREQLEGWSIPEEIVARAPESPWGFSRELFSRRAEAAGATDMTPTTLRGLEALPTGGTVLDVGVGGGAASLPLASRAGLIVGVDGQQDMLEAFQENAATRGVEVRTVLGSWPDVGSDVEGADVVVAGHVIYNTADPASFVRALDEHARHRVVLELTERHPLEWMRDLWMRFHSLERPHGPNVQDAIEILEELGFDVEREDRTVTSQQGGGGFARRDGAIHLVRKRLCLPADRDPEIEEALGDRLRRVGDLWDIGPDPRTIVTVWWDSAS